MISPRIAVLALSMLLSACATAPRIDYKAELDARRPADVVLGEPVHLFDQMPKRVEGLIAQDGRAHVFHVDAARVLRHAEVDRRGEVVRTQIATLEGDISTFPFHAVEFPPGTLRVAAGSTLFVRTAPNPAWDVRKGNRCERFLVVQDRLLCAFVMSGEEFGAPKRTDVFGGVFILIPFGSVHERIARKIVLAEAVADTWVARAVVDARDPLDALGIGMIGADAAGNVHVLHFAGDKSGALLFFPPGLIAMSSTDRLRYARVGREAIRAASADPAQTAPAAVSVVNSHEAGLLPWSLAPKYEEQLRTISKLHNRFAVTPASGVIEGLAQVSTPDVVRVGKSMLEVEGLVDVSMTKGDWDESVTVVLTRDWPSAGVTYLPFVDPRVRVDTGGALHALVTHCTTDVSWLSWTGCPFGISYLVKRDGAWSRPVVIDGGPLPKSAVIWNEEAHALLLAGAERSFAAWMHDEMHFSGRWILRGRGKP